MIWKCRGCGNEYEAPEHKFGTPLPECPKCGGKNFPHVPVQYDGKDFPTNNIRSRQEVNNKVVDRDVVSKEEAYKSTVHKPKIKVINKGDKY